MMKNRLITDFWREVRRNKGRFVSIFLIVLLGAAFFAGIRSTEYDMQYSADRFYDDYKLMDFRIISTLGLTEEDLEDIRSTEGVESVTGGHTAEAMTMLNEKEYAVRLIGITEGVNEIYLEEGRLPESDDECVIDRYMGDKLGIHVGDEITFFLDEDPELSDSLTQNTYTVVGAGGLPYYTDLSRGTGSIGNGTINMWVGLRQNVFVQDVYTEAYVRMSDAAELKTYEDAYEDLAETVEKRLKEVGDVACHRRYNSLLSDLEEAKAELADAEQQLTDTRQQLEDGKTQLAQGETSLEEKEAELADARQQYADGLTQLADARQQYADGLSQYNSGYSQYQAGLAQYQAGLAEYQAGLNEYNEGYQQYQNALPQYQAALKEYESGLEEYNNGLVLYNAGNAALQAGESYYQIRVAEVEQLRTKVENGELDPAVLEAAESSLQAYRTQLDEKAAELAATKQQLDEAKAQLDEFEAVKAQMESTEASLSAAKAQLDAGYQTLTVSKLRLDATAEQLKQSKEQLDDAEEELEEGEQELEEAAAQIEEGETALTEAREQLEEKKQELADGEEEYRKAYEEAQPKFADAREQIAQGEEELNSLEIPEWYVLGRNMISSYVNYGQDAERMKSLGTVFPVIFFLVAALVSLTAMTRMVEEQRMQIGTLKALGYADSHIAMKFLGYALCATLTGSLAGSFIGEKIIPLIIMVAYQILYVAMPYVDVPINVGQTVFAVLASVLCISAATLMACWKELRTNPAQLMRPEAPKNGKRVLLEHITILWRHLSFNQKTTLRNLFRYKKRFIMTIIGIGGCMALLLVGFGLEDSITEVAKRQYVDIFMNEASVTLDTSSKADTLRKLRNTIEAYDGIDGELEVYIQNVELETDGHSRSAYLYVPEETDQADEYLRLRNRISKEVYEYPSEGVALAEKTAKTLDVKAGDTISLKIGDRKAVSVTVEAVVENYVQHYIFMSPELYQTLYGEKPEYNVIYLNYADTSEAYEDALASELMRQDGCLGVSFTTDMEQQIEDMLKSLDIVILVLIVSAGALAFVVLYNLNNINITERRRELATLKVLGFYDVEVAMNVYRENIILTLLGIAAGMVMGMALHQYVIQTVEVEVMMFGRLISVKSYVISGVIAFAFAVFVNFMTYFRLKKIDMVESLKSVE